MIETSKIVFEGMEKHLKSRGYLERVVMNGGATIVFTLQFSYIKLVLVSSVDVYENAVSIEAISNIEVIDEGSVMNEISKKINPFLKYGSFYIINTLAIGTRYSYLGAASFNDQAFDDELDFIINSILMYAQKLIKEKRGRFFEKDYGFFEFFDNFILKIPSN